MRFCISVTPKQHCIEASSCQRDLQRARKGKIEEMGQIRKENSIHQGPDERKVTENLSATQYQNCRQSHQLERSTLTMYKAKTLLNSHQKTGIIYINSL